MKLNRAAPFVSGFLALAFVAGMGGQEALEAQQDGQQRTSSGRARVLVATFQTQGQVDDDFGEEIAEKVRDRVSKFDLLTAVSDDEVEDALDKFGLESTNMDLISWRQLASRLNAQLIVYGEVSQGGSSSSEGNRVNALFVESSRGDTTQVPEFSVPGDGGDAAEEAASQIAQTLDSHVAFLRSRLNCQDYLSSEQFEDARRNCDQALEIRPNNGQALYLRGQIAVEQEQWEEAVDYLERAFKQSPSDEQTLQSLAYAHAQAGNTDRSLELYRQYLEFNPEDVDVRLSVAYRLAEAGAYAEAMNILQDGIKRDSTSASLWKYLGDVAIRQGTAGDQGKVGGSTNISDTSAIRTALQAYRKFTSLRPDSVDASLYRNMIGANLQLGDEQAAADLSVEALQKLPEEPGLWSLRADVLAKQEDLADAISAMDSVVALDSTYSNAFFKRGVFKLRQGNMESAMEDFRAAIEQGTDPNAVAQQLFATGHSNYFQAGDYREAVNMFRAALEFVQAQDLARQLHFWAGYGTFKLGESIDQQNQQAEACEPARRALDHFEEVLPHINQAGDYQAESQQQITQAVDVYIYRQEQIVKKSC